MKTLTLVAALVAALAAPGVASRAVPASPARSIDGAIDFSASDAAPSLAGLVTTPPQASGARDTADSLYREAREALNRGDYARAADMFRRLYRDFPQSRYAPDAPYWQAFALYRRDDSGAMRDALAALELQRTKYPRAGTRGDARTLETRIKGRLATEGDSEAAEDIERSTRELERTSRDAEKAQRDAERASRRVGGPSASAGCSDEEGDDRVAALNALMQMSAERALPILQRVLARRDACSEILRRKAVFLVAQHPTAETEDILTATIRNDPDSEVRQQAVFWLSQVNTDKAVSTLEEILRTSKDTELQEKALFALSQHRRPRAQELLRETANRDDAPQEIREKAIFWIGQRRDGDNFAFLKSLYGRLQNEDLKEKIIFSISQMQGDESRQWLMDVALNAREHVEMRKKALFWVGQSGASLAPLIALYEKLPDRELQEQLIFVYSQRRETAAVDKLLAIAKSEKDQELRKKAIFWLSQSRDPRVAKFLQDLIEQ